MNDPRKLPFNQKKGRNSASSEVPPPQKETPKNFSHPQISEGMRKAANATINYLAKRFGCGLPDLLKPLKNQVEKGQVSPFVLRILVERVKEQLKRKESHGKWNMETRMDIEEAETFLREFGR